MAGRLTPPSLAHPGTVAAAGLLLGLAAFVFVLNAFSMTTDTDALLSKGLDWRRQEVAFDTAFPQPGQIVVVIDGATPELAEQAAASLTARLQAKSQLFKTVQRPDGGEFWARDGLLYESPKDVQSEMNTLISAQPFLGPLAADPSLRGLGAALSTLASGVSSGQAGLDNLRKPAASLADALDGLEAGKPAFFSWRTLVAGKADPHELRRLVLVDPQLDYNKLEPGSDASGDIRAAARALNLDAAHGVRVRLTGPVPLEDEEFGTLKQGLGLIGALSFLAILTMLWLAVRSVRTIVCILLTTILGLICAMTFGLLIFHRFNLISVAFIPLFVGLGVDFGIQFSVRFRAEQHLQPDLKTALTTAGAVMSAPLTLAAAAISAGFLAFGPTQYMGVSQLGVIAGCGLIFALVLNLSLLPALLRLTGPKPGRLVVEAAPPLRRLDAFMLAHRKAVVGSGLGAAAFCAALLPLLHFDFNPMHLRSPKVESVATLLDLMKDPDESPNTMEALTPSLGAAQALGARIAVLPEVSGVRTLDSFIPADQPAKLASISDASMLLDLTLNPVATAGPPSDADNQTALAKAAADLNAAAAAKPGPAAGDVRRLAGDLQRLASGPAA
ncbi:MAG: MMPL family transporter, partial [Caulobacteraceae bacterium]|nr:MMPL family transporter [Caulobacteraceae bacterium]